MHSPSSSYIFIYKSKKVFFILVQVQLTFANDNPDDVLGLGLACSAAREVEGSPSSLEEKEALCSGGLPKVAARGKCSSEKRSGRGGPSSARRHCCSRRRSLRSTFARARPRRLNSSIKREI